MKSVNKEIFNLPADKLAPLLLGKYLCRKVNGEVIKAKIVETEAYMGENDTASHAHKGKTPRTSVLWESGGTIYIYLCYGLHQMLNIVCSTKGDPQAVLIRGVEGAVGPGRLTKQLQIDKILNGKSILSCEELWIENGETPSEIKTSPRIGIDYASECDRLAKLRFYI